MGRIIQRKGKSFIGAWLRSGNNNNANNAYNLDTDGDGYNNYNTYNNSLAVRPALRSPAKIAGGFPVSDAYIDLRTDMKRAEGAFVRPSAPKKREAKQTQP